MQELTRIITLEITTIGNADEACTKEEAAKGLRETLKNGIPVTAIDDVVVTNVQDFVRDVEEK